VGEARRRREAEKARLAAIVTPLGDDGLMVYTEALAKQRCKGDPA